MKSIEKVYSKKDHNGRTTIVSFLLNQITDFQQHFQNSMEYMLQSANSGKMKEVMDIAAQIKTFQEEIKGLTHHFIQNCTVSDVIENIKHFDLNDVIYTYKYIKAVTVTEREQLIKLSYQFQDVKIK
jgi:hypothetical protein